MARPTRALAGLISVTAALAPAAFAARPDAGPCAVIVLPTGGWADLALPVRDALLAMQDEASFGSVSCAVPRPMTEASAWVTFGAGNRAVWCDAGLPEGRRDFGNLHVA